MLMYSRLNTLLDIHLDVALNTENKSTEYLEIVLNKTFETK